MFESSVLARIVAHMAKNLIKAALEADVQLKLAFEASPFETNKVMEIGENHVSKLVGIDHSTMVEGHKDKSESQRLDCIYYNEPLGFEKEPLVSSKRMQAQNPLEKIDLGDGTIKKPTYISVKIDPSLKIQMIEFLKEFNDCFFWDYDEILGLNRDVVELKLPTRRDKRLVKQTPRRFAQKMVNQKRNLKALEEEVHTNCKVC